MSSYIAKTKHPITGKWQDALWLDDYYGRHHYGVLFDKSGKDITLDYPKYFDEEAFDPEKINLLTK